MHAPSVVLIESRQPGNTAIGSGFVIEHTPQATFVVTCAHVVRDMGGPEHVAAAGQPAVLVAMGEDNGLDLAVLRLPPLPTRPALPLAAGGAPGQHVQIEGYSKYVTYRTLETISGHLTRSFRLSDARQQHFATAWYIAIDDQARLLAGYSGSPVCDAATGAVLAVMITRDGDQQGRALSIAALPLIWPDLPPGLLGTAETPTASRSAPDSPTTPPPARPEHEAPGSAVVNFGSGNTIGDITIGDIAGRDNIKLSLTPSASGEQGRHIAVYLAAHPRLRGVADGQAGETVIDWTDMFRSADPEEPLWQQQLIPELERHLRSFRRSGGKVIDVRAFARHSAGLAFGHTFCRRAGFQIHYTDNYDMVWRTDAPAATISPLSRHDHPVSEGGSDIALEIAVTQKLERVTLPAEAQLQSLRPRVYKRVQLSLERDPLEVTPAEGAAIARQVCELISTEVPLGATTYLFGALPLGVSIFIGWGLKAGTKVQAHELVELGEGRVVYRPTCLLRDG